MNILRKLLNYLRTNPEIKDYSDLRNLANNSTVDLFHLHNAVKAHLNACKIAKKIIGKDSELLNSTIKSLSGWQVMIEGAQLDAKDREAKEWVEKQMKEIFN